MKPVVVRRSALRVWLLALLAAPFWVFGADLLLEQRLLGWLADQVYTGEVPAFEARDSIWAWLFLIVGLAVTGWALKELLAPRKVLIGNEEGVAVAVAGPLLKSVLIPWDEITGIEAERASDDGETLDVLVLTTTNDDRWPEHLWSSRRVGGGSVMLLASDWDTKPETVTDRLWKLSSSLGHGSRPAVDS